MFSEQVFLWKLFDNRFSYKDCNCLILVKMVSKTVTSFFSGFWANELSTNAAHYQTVVVLFPSPRTNLFASLTDSFVVLFSILLNFDLEC